MAAADKEHTEIEQALLRNDRYLAEFIEAMGVCPYARNCRESGRLHREVLLLDEPTVDALVSHILDLENALTSQVDVALVLLPRLKWPAPEFERLISQVQRTYQKSRRPNQHGTAAFFVVAFHPDSAMHLHNPHVAVRFMRRSPDPTIQLVRPEAIERVRGEREADVLSRQIAEAGLRAVLQRGAEESATLLGGIRASFR